MWFLLLVTMSVNGDVTLSRHSVSQTQHMCQSAADSLNKTRVIEASKGMKRYSCMSESNVRYAMEALFGHSNVWRR
jgi:hypothetical protein